MHVHESGSRDTQAILFLHGSGATADLWRYHVRHFSGYHCIVPELPGFGDSAEEPWRSIEETAADLADIIVARAGGRAHVVGISIGGALAMRLVSDRWDLVNHAVVDGASVLPLAWLPLYRMGLRAIGPFIRTDLVTATIARVLGFPEGSVDGLRRNFRRMHPASFVAAIRDALDFREPPGLARAPCPTLFVAGAREPRATLASNQMLAAKMPHAAARVVPGFHHGWIANDPGLHIRIVEAWINGRALPAELNSA